MTSRGEQTRERILVEAARVFNRKGFAATTVNDLLKATGTTKGNLYFHFPGKEEVGLEVFRRESQDFSRFLDEALRAQTPGAALDQFFRMALEKHRQKSFVGGCLFGNTALEASDTSPVFANLVAEVFAEWIGKVAGTIAAAQAIGEIRADACAQELAELVVATIEGAIMQARLQKSELPLQRALDTLRKVLELKV